MRTESGIHTFSLTISRLRYQQLQSIVHDAYDMKFQLCHQSDRYHLDHVYRLNQFAELGVRLELYQYCSRPSCAKLVLTPGSLLSGTYNPLRLYHGEKVEWREVDKRYKDLLPIPSLLEDYSDYSLSRIDVTWDFYLKNSEGIVEWVRVIKKSMRSSRYQKKEFTAKSRGIKNHGEANRHSCEYCTAVRRKDRKSGREYGIQPQTAFKAYDKRYETRDRMKLGENVLRLELSLNRQSLISKLKVKAGISNQKLLDKAACKSPKLIRKYLSHALFVRGRFLRYDDAVKLISESEEVKEKHRQDMLRLVRKCSDCDNLYHALEGMNMKPKQRKRLLERFEAIGISPVTLRNDSALQSLPSLADLVSSK